MQIYLAPMEGVIDNHMRYLLDQLGGIDLCVTEFIRVSKTVLPNHIFLSACPELTPQAQRIDTEDSMYGARSTTRVQLLGSDPELLALNAQKAVQLGARAIDFNFGCPAKTVNRSYGGARLLDETALLHDIVQATRQLVPASTLVTAKIRLGYEDRGSYLRNAIALAQAGADELVVHARSKADGYQPPAYWGYIKEIKQNIDIPVIANGEIWTVEDYIDCREQSGCDSVMLGRGILARPDLGLAIKAYVQGKEYQFLTWPKIAELALRLLRLTQVFYPAKHMGNRIKQWLFYLQRTYPQATTLFEAIKRSRDFDFIEQALIAETISQ
ncbi:tRNA dihydrouridine(16) synthase DusC [Gammaproteobacteria bacterium 54_18_T64]|nr:tRNA dihydrouridine(16) synthase DusC [Gammaproteobacteria bacterium 54_18_T64]